MKKKIDWTSIKKDYISENLRTNKTKPFELKELAVRWNIAYKTVRNHSSKNKWSEELQKKTI